MKIKGSNLPKVLGILIIIPGVLLTLLLTQSTNLFQSRATPSQTPNDVRITNVSDSSFTVTYTTDDKVLGTINFGQDANNLTDVALDDRDQLSQTVNNYAVHSITAKELKPNTVYYFEINSADKKYKNNDSAYVAKTGSTITASPPDQLPMSGKVLESSGKAVSEGIIYASINGAQNISALIKNDGSYLISLNNLRDSSLINYFTIPASSIIAVEAKTNSSNAKATVGAGDINPVAPITLSNNYDFSTQVAATVSNPTDQQGSSFPSVGQKTTEPLETPSPTPTQTPLASPIPSPTSVAILPEEISPSPIDPEPTLMTTGQSSVIMIPVSLGLLALGALMLLSTGKKFRP
jgi:hypothetical protein